MEMRQKIAQLVKRVRGRLDMSVREFAKELGVSASSVTMYEQGKRLPKRETFYWLLEKDGRVTFYETDCPTCNGTGIITTTKLPANVVLPKDWYTN